MIARHKTHSYVEDVLGDADVEQLVLEALTNSPEPLGLAELVDTINGDHGPASASAVREAMWRLISRSAIELTSERKVRVRPKR